jgi:hypothetical protein
MTSIESQGGGRREMCEMFEVGKDVRGGSCLGPTGVIRNELPRPIDETSPPRARPTAHHQQRL